MKNTLKQEINNIIKKYVSYYKDLQDYNYKNLKDYVNIDFWYMVSDANVSSEDFIDYYVDNFDFTRLSDSRKFSNHFYEKHKDRIHVDEDSWMYWTIEQKKLFINEKYPDCKIIGNYLISYKAVDNGYYDFIMNQQFEVGKSYEVDSCNCIWTYDDPTTNGLITLDYEKAKEFGLAFTDGNNCKILEVYINLDDLGCITELGTIRSYKFKVVNEINTDKPSKFKIKRLAKTKLIKDIVINDYILDSYGLIYYDELNNELNTIILGTNKFDLEENKMYNLDVLNDKLGILI